MKVLGKSLSREKKIEGETMMYLGWRGEERSGSDWLIVP